MNKTVLIDSIAGKSGLTRSQAENALKAFTDTISDALKEGEKVQIIGFGTFEVKDRPARTGHNPATGEPMEFPAKKIPVFKAGKGLKDMF
jgi:DNA-binding protein HU-beta